MLDWKALDGEAKTLAHSFLKQRTAEESLLYRGMVISLAGAFEQFVRRLLRDSVQAISAGGVRYDTLDEHMKLENAYRTGIALQTIREPLDYMDLDYETLAKNLGTCFDGSAKAILNADAFSIFLSIISPKSLVDALRRIGMDLRWDDLGRVDALRDTLGKQDTRETAKAIEEFLKRFGQTRNKIAHSGNTGIVVTESDLEQLLKFFRAFAVALSAVVETQLSKRAKK
jgi:RiboL-PSP-HEPN